jgi:surface antigen
MSYTPIPVPTPVPTPGQRPSTAVGASSGRILVNTDRLRALAASLRGIAAQMASMSEWPTQAMARVELEVHECLALTADAQEASRLCTRLREQAESMANYLVSKAERFEQADRQGVQSINGLHVEWSKRQGQAKADLQKARDIERTAFINQLDNGIAADRSNNAGRNDNQCVSWARQRRRSLGGTPLPEGLAAAKDYKELFPKSQIDGSKLTQIMSSRHQTLEQILRPGSAIVWGSEKGGGWGHIAIVEAVTNDGVYISESNVSEGWTPNGYGTPPVITGPIPVDQLSSTTILPPNAVH